MASALYPSPYPGPHPGPYPSPCVISKQIIESNADFSSHLAQPGEAWGDMGIEGFLIFESFYGVLIANGNLWKPIYGVVIANG